MTATRVAMLKAIVEIVVGAAKQHPNRIEPQPMC